MGCPTCAEPVLPEDLFCESCGARVVGLVNDAFTTSDVVNASFTTTPPVNRTPVGGPVPDESDGCMVCGHRAVEDGFCLRCGRQQPYGRDRMFGDLGVVCGVSHRGVVREHNADGMAFGSATPPDGPLTVVAVVCDGVGSTVLSDKAAQAAADAAAGELLRQTAEGATDHPSAVAVAAQAVVGLSTTETPSTTYVAAVASAAGVSLAWLGDSRVYWIAGDASPGVEVTDGGMVSGSACLTIDHTARNALLVEGQKATHTLTRWIGADARDMTPQTLTVHPTCPGTLLVCTDGLWGYLPEPESLATHVLSSPTPAEAVASLLDAALERGGRDNITVVAVPFPPEGAP